MIAQEAWIIAVTVQAKEGKMACTVPKTFLPLATPIGMAPPHRPAGMQPGQRSSYLSLIRVLQQAAANNKEVAGQILP